MSRFFDEIEVSPAPEDYPIHPEYFLDILQYEELRKANALREWKKSKPRRNGSNLKIWMFVSEAPCAERANCKAALHPSLSPRNVRKHSARFLICFIAAFFGLSTSKAFPAELQRRTTRAFDQYIAALEARLAREERSPSTFLSIQNLPSARQSAVRTMLREGMIEIRHVHARNPAGQAISVPGGWVHDFVGDVFAPRASVSHAVGVLLDFSHFPDYYRPEIIRGKILSRSGNDFKVYLRLQRTSPVNFTVDMLEDAQLRELDSSHAAIWTRSYRIAQIENAGKPDEHEDPPGQGSGYIWRMNTYWAVEEWRGGVLVEMEIVALSRTIPFGLNWLVGPLVSRVAQATVRSTMAATRDAIFARAGATFGASPEAPQPVPGKN